MSKWDDLLYPHTDRFTVLMYVSPYMEERWNKEQLEMAAEILFFQTLVTEPGIIVHKPGVTVEWAANIFSDRKLIVARARVTKPQEDSSAEAQDHRDQLRSRRARKR